MLVKDRGCLNYGTPCTYYERPMTGYSPVPVAHLCCLLAISDWLVQCPVGTRQAPINI